MGNNPVSGVDPDGGFVDMNHRNYNPYKYEAYWKNYYAKMEYENSRAKSIYEKRDALEAWYKKELEDLNYLGKQDRITPEQLKTELAKLEMQFGELLGALGSEGWAADGPDLGRSPGFKTLYGDEALGYEGWKEKQWLEGRTYEFQQSRRIHELAAHGGYEDENGKTWVTDENGNLIEKTKPVQKPAEKPKEEITNSSNSIAGASVSNWPPKWLKRILNKAKCWNGEQGNNSADKFSVRARRGFSAGFRIGHFVYLDIRFGKPKKNDYDVNFPGRNGKETKGIGGFYYVDPNSKAGYTQRFKHIYFGGRRWFNECFGHDTAENH